MMLRFGAKVRTLRKQRRLTLRDMADVLGVHYTHVQKMVWSVQPRRRKKMAQTL